MASLLPTCTQNNLYIAIRRCYNPVWSQARPSAAILPHSEGQGKSQRGGRKVRRPHHKVLVQQGHSYSEGSPPCFWRTLCPGTVGTASWRHREVPDGFSFDPTRDHPHWPAQADNANLLSPASSCQGPGCFAVAQVKKLKRLFSFPNTYPCPIHLEKPLSFFFFFFAKAPALHFERRKYLCGWVLNIPMTDCSLTAASQHLCGSRHWEHPSGRHGAGLVLALWRVGSLAARNKLTFKWVCLDNRKCKSSSWQVIPFKAALQAWQAPNWHRSSEQQIHTT